MEECELGSGISRPQEAPALKAGSFSPMTGTGAGWEGQKLSVQELRGAAERKQGLVCCESGTEASPGDGGSAGKSPLRAPPQCGFPGALEKRENRLLTAPP